MSENQKKSEYEIDVLKETIRKLVAERDELRLTVAELAYDNDIKSEQIMNQTKYNMMLRKRVEELGGLDDLIVELPDDERKIADVFLEIDEHGNLRFK